VIIPGYISEYDNEHLTVIAPFSKPWLIEKREITECEINLTDGRKISPDQRAKIYATFRDIADYTGYLPDQVKALSKYDFIAKTGCNYFSLRDCDMTTAYEFTLYLIDFCLSNDIPVYGSLLDRTPDISMYIYICLLHKKCCITGKKAELHHVDTVGMGRNRNKIIHLGMRVLPLCREKHMEYHNIGGETFCKKYHVFGIKLDKKLCEVWNLKGK